jgi:pilus assembly protein CpaB
MWVPLAMAILLGLTAAVVARKSLLRTRAATAAAVTTTTITVAKDLIQPGQELTHDHLTTSTIAASAVPSGAFASPELIFGRVTVVPVVAGQTILEQFLAPRGAGSGLQALVPSGMRAITLDVNESSGLAGMVTPGCRVDLVATALSQESPDKSISRTIVQNVPVVAVGQRLSGPKPDNERESATSRTVTLLVSPHDAQTIDLAITTARLRLILRGSGDATETDDEGVMMAELRGAGPTVVMPAVIQTPIPAQTQPSTRPATIEEEPQRRIVRFIEGGQERQVIFRDEKPNHAGEAVSDNKSMQDNVIPQDNAGPQDDPFKQ